MSELTSSEGGFELRAHLLECTACRTLARMMAGGGDESVGPMTEACAEMEPLLAALADAELEAGDQRLVEEHLADCARCTAATAALLLDLEGISALRSPREALDRRPGAGEIQAPFQPAVEPSRRVPPRKRRPRAGAIAAAAALSVAAAAALALFLMKGRATQKSARVDHLGPAAGVVKKPKKPKKKKAKRRDEPIFAIPDWLKEEVEAETLPERLRRTDISRGIAKVRDDVARCAEQGDLSKREKVVVRLVVAPSGRVAEATTAEDSAITRCVVDAIAEARFPRSQRGMTANYPFILGPRAAAGSSAATLVKQAQAAAKQAQFGKALRLCQAALAQAPADQRATLVCAIAACNLKSASNAEQHIQRLASLGQQSMARQICKRNGIHLDKPDPQRASSAAASTLVERAQAAAKSSEFGEALRLCQAALAQAPADQRATLVCAIAACNLEAASAASRYVARLRSPAQTNMARQICLRNGVVLD